MKFYRKFMDGILKIILDGFPGKISMKYVFLRSIQILAMLILLSGLIWGIKDKNVMLEINALIISSCFFYLANILLKKK